MIPPDTTPFTPRPPADCALCSGPLGGNRVCCRACLDADAEHYVAIRKAKRAEQARRRRAAQRGGGGRMACQDCGMAHAPEDKAACIEGHGADPDEQRVVIRWPTCDRCDSTSVEVFGLGTANVITLCRRHIAEHNTERLQEAFDRGYAGDVTGLGLIVDSSGAYPVNAVTLPMTDTVEKA